MGKETEETQNCLLPFGNGNDAMIISEVLRHARDIITIVTPLTLREFPTSIPVSSTVRSQPGSGIAGNNTREQQEKIDSVSGTAKARPNSRKRKSISTGSDKESPASSSLTASNCKISEEKCVTVGGKRSKQKESKSDNKDDEKPPKPHKDYIHVRARRGQATDSHSIAERARREKISERMKLLQDLVPGCNRITLKAVMLDEIINYVQSLQRQFLSMKLATINPRTEFNADTSLSEEVLNQLFR